MTTVISANEQSSDGYIDVQSLVCEADPHQVESRLTTMESIESVQIDSVPHLSPVSEDSGAGSHEDQLPVVPDGRLSGESSVSAPSDTQYSVVSPQDSRQSEAPFVEGNFAVLAISSAETIVRTDIPLEAMESHNQDVSTAMGAQDLTPVSTDEWFPYTLSWQYLSLLMFITLALMITVIVLYWYSATHYGLWDVNDSAVTFFGWRFAPSIFAVIYVQMTAMLLDDVKRTEPFARMARPSGAPGASTILQSPGAWWNALSDGISKKKNVRRRSWVLVASSLINILGFLTISPLSPSLLEPATVAMAKPTNFTARSVNATLPVTVGRETYLRILGNILQDVSTSAWITDEYVAFPVWPSHLDKIPLEPSLSSTPEAWAVETIIMNTDLDCTPMELRDTTILYESDDSSRVANHSISLASNDGCICNITFQSTAQDTGFAFWGQPPESDSISTNTTSECGDREFIISMPSLLDQDAKQMRLDLNTSAHICSAHYYMAQIKTTIQSAGALSSISFDRNRYIKERTPIPFDTLNIDAFQQLALSSNWSMYTPFIAPIPYDTRPWLNGLNLPLGALYDFDMERMVKDRSLVTQAKRIKQRVFGEVIQYSLLQQGDSNNRLMSGEVTTDQRRILVIAGVAITVAVILQISSILLILVWILSRQCRRVLNLRGDPAKTTTVCSLITNQPNIRQTLLGFDRSSEKQLYETICEKDYDTSYRGLHEREDGRALSAEELNRGSSTSITSIPIVLRLRSFCSLLVSLVLVLASTLVLYKFAQRSNLHQAFFTYNASITVLGRKSPSIAPMSIIPTLVAVGIGLWWGSIDATFRKLQPFLSMANAPTNAARGVALSYQSSYWIAATIKAASNRHWFLCFITIGTTLSQILTISMFALFQRNQTNEIVTVVAERSLEIRDVPFTYETRSPSSLYVDTTPFAVISHLYTELSTNWLYSATLQLALNASQPKWSRDGWSFVPLDTQGLATGRISDQSRASLFEPMINITVQTPAIRARLDCTPYGELENHTQWLTHTDATNSSIWDQSTIPKNISDAYQLGRDNGRYGSMFGSKFFNTTFLTHLTTIQCCSNGTDNAAGQVALEYWSLDMEENTYAVGPLDISIKWVYGNGMSGPRKSGDDKSFKRLLFTDVPAMSAIRCTPFMETSEAIVTVRGDTGEVQSFTILSAAEKYDHAWSDAFVVRDKDPRIDEYNGLVNSTTSFGVLFERSLLTSADVEGIISGIPQGKWEDLDDQAFNIRDSEKGLNLDFMTYSMYMKARQDPTAFTNVSALEDFAQETFSTFFQHFVSSNVSLITGSWAYQPINATLPAELGAVDTYVNKDHHENANYSIPHSQTNRTATIRVSTPMEVLEVNAAAVWLSTGIILWLIVTTIIVGALQRRYLRNLNRNIDCLGDALVLVAGSDRLLRLVNERGPSGLDGEKGILTKLGWLEDERGQQRWGIEVVDVPGELDENTEASEQVTGTTADGPSSYELLPTQSWRS